MHIQEHIELSKYTTLRLGGVARYFIVIQNNADIEKAVDFAKSKGVPIFVLGDGSNVVVSDVIPDMVFLKMETRDKEIIFEDDKMVQVRVSAGETWDTFVEWTVEHKFAGLEALSAIPGTCGATPVQNVGAYGAQVSDVIESVRIYDLKKKEFQDLSNSQCQFSYRDSIFKKELRGKCIIESVVYRLKKSEPVIPEYGKVGYVIQEIQEENKNLSKNQLIRKTIQTIRAEKLPDPKVIANVGSFFKNIFIDQKQFEELVKKFPDIPHFISGETIKIPSGWLIEKAGFKGFVWEGVGTYDKNALVLINNFATSAKEILDLAKIIQKAVDDMFSLKLEIEPQVI